MTLLTAADRTHVRQAIDRARRAQVEAAGGYTSIEREDRRRDREAGCDPFASDAQAARIAELEEQVRELRRERGVLRRNAWRSRKRAQNHRAEMADLRHQLHAREVALKRAHRLRVA